MIDKTYNIFGMGHALTDEEYKISDDVLKELGYAKGSTHLIDAETMIEIKKYFNEKSINRTLISSGGSAANTIITLANLGHTTYFCCNVSNDENGNIFLADFNQSQVCTNKNAKYDSDDHTGTCLVLITEDKERTMLTHLGLSSNIMITDNIKQNLIESKYFYFESYLVGTSHGEQVLNELVDTALDNGVKVIMNLSDINLIRGCKESLTKIINQKIYMTICNKAEALEMSDTTSLDDAIAYLKQKVQKFIITTSSEGSVAWDGHSVKYSPSFNVKVKDSTGAGDAFASGFIDVLISTNEDNMMKAQESANKLASLVISKEGARLNKDEIINMYT